MITPHSWSISPSTTDSPDSHKTARRDRLAPSRDIYSHSISDISSPKIGIYSRHHALERQGEGNAPVAKQSGCPSAVRREPRSGRKRSRYRLCGRVCHVQAPCVPAYTYCRAGCSGRRFLRFSCVLPCTRLSTIKSYNIRFPGRRISRNPCKTRAKRIL